MSLLASIADLFWSLALVLGIILVVSLLLGVLSQARYNHGRRRAREQGRGDAWSL